MMSAVQGIFNAALSLRLLQAGAAGLRCGIGYVRLGSQELNSNAQADRRGRPVCASLRIA
jgi:hypothetical protein